MERTEWTIIQDYWDYKVENTLFTYSETERQENIINKNNASLINYADFYPLYTWFMYSDLSLIECVILSYLYYWTKNWKWIYTSNDELAKLTKSSRAVITKTLKHLSDLWYIDMKIKRIVWAWTDRKMKINVDMMRILISNTNSDHTELISSSQTTQNEQSDYSNWVVIKELYNNKINSLPKQKDSNKHTKTSELDIIKNSDDIRDIFNDDEIAQHKIQLKIILKMVELWYKVNKSKADIEKEFERLKAKAKLYWLIQWNWDIARTTFYQKIDKRFDWHTEKWKKVKNFKTSIIPFISK